MPANLTHFNLYRTPRPRPVSRVRTPSAGYVATALILTCVIPLVLVASAKIELSLAFLLSFSLTLYAGFRLTTVAFQCQRSFLQLTFWLFVYCWLGVSASLQIGTGTFPLPAVRQSSENLTYSMSVIFAGLIAYELGISSKVGYKTIFVRRVKTEHFAVPSFARYIAITIACLAVSVVALEIQGGIKSAMVPRRDVGQQQLANHLTKAEGLVGATLTHGPPIIALLVTTYLLAFSAYSGRHKQALSLIFLVLLGYNWIANYPPSLARVALGSDLIAVALILLSKHAKLKPAFTVAMVLTLLILFPYLDYFRRSQGYELSAVRSPVEVLTQKGDYDSAQMVSNTVALVTDHGVDWGRQLLGDVCFFVPRSIWSTKPFGAGQTVGAQLGYTFLNLSCPLWGELYYGGAIPFVLFGFWLYGALTRRIEAAASIGGRLVVLLAYASGFQIFLLRGDLMNAIAYSIPSLLLIGTYFLKFSFGPSRRAAASRTMLVRFAARAQQAPTA